MFSINHNALNKSVNAEVSLNHSQYAGSGRKAVGLLKLDICSINNKTGHWVKKVGGLMFNEPMKRLTSFFSKAYGFVKKDKVVNNNFLGMVCSRRAYDATKPIFERNIGLWVELWGRDEENSEENMLRIADGNEREQALNPGYCLVLPNEYRRPSLFVVNEKTGILPEGNEGALLISTKYFCDAFLIRVAICNLTHVVETQSFKDAFVCEMQFSSHLTLSGPYLTGDRVPSFVKTIEQYGCLSHTVRRTVATGVFLVTKQMAESEGVYFHPSYVHNRVYSYSFLDCELGNETAQLRFISSFSLYSSLRKEGGINQGHCMLEGPIGANSSVLSFKSDATNEIGTKCKLTSVFGEFSMLKTLPFSIQLKTRDYYACIDNLWNGYDRLDVDNLINQGGIFVGDDNWTIFNHSSKTIFFYPNPDLNQDPVAISSNDVILLSRAVNSLNVNLCIVFGVISVCILALSIFTCRRRITSCLSDRGHRGELAEQPGEKELLISNFALGNGIVKVKSVHHRSKTHLFDRGHRVELAEQPGEKEPLISNCVLGNGIVKVESVQYRSKNDHVICDISH